MDNCFSFTWLLDWSQVNWKCVLGGCVETLFGIAWRLYLLQYFKSQIVDHWFMDSGKDVGFSLSKTKWLRAQLREFYPIMDVTDNKISRKSFLAKTCSLNTWERPSPALPNCKRYSIQSYDRFRFFQVLEKIINLRFLICFLNYF